MDNVPLIAEHGQLTFRWFHILAGVLWIGLLYFFNWVNGPFAATMDAETKKKVVPELMPRALYFFRWGAAWTWVTGVILMLLLYYTDKGGAGPIFYAGTSEHAGTVPGFGTWIQPLAGVFVGFLVYDILFKTLGAKQHTAAVLIWGAIAVLYAMWLEKIVGASGRAVFIHVGALLGTAMAANVWMRIWPAQIRIITAIKNGQAPQPADPAIAGQRSKHNTYMSVPLLIFMLSVHQTKMLGATPNWMWVAICLAVGWVICWAIYKKAAKVPGF
jgi:uncharacterized membrane protein